MQKNANNIKKIYISKITSKILIITKKLKNAIKDPIY